MSIGSMMILGLFSSDTDTIRYLLDRHIEHTQTTDQQRILIETAQHKGTFLFIGFEFDICLNWLIFE